MGSVQFENRRVRGTGTSSLSTGCWASGPGRPQLAGVPSGAERAA